MVLRLHPEDAIFYQEFGRGRDELAWLHIEDLIDSFGEDVPEVLQDVAEQRRAMTLSPASHAAVYSGFQLRMLCERAMPYSPFW